MCLLASTRPSICQLRPRHWKKVGDSMYCTTSPLCIYSDHRHKEKRMWWNQPRWMLKVHRIVLLLTHHQFTSEVLMVAIHIRAPSGWAVVDNDVRACFAVVDSLSWLQDTTTKTYSKWSFWNKVPSPLSGNLPLLLNVYGQHLRWPTH